MISIIFKICQLLQFLDKFIKSYFLVKECVVFVRNSIRKGKIHNKMGFGLSPFLLF